MSTTRRTSRGGNKVRRSTAARRTAVPPARHLSGLGGSFKHLLGMLGAASTSLEQARKPWGKGGSR